MTQAKKTLVLGASENPARYSNMAMQRLAKHGHPVIAIGKTKGRAHHIEIHNTPVVERGIDTVTLYLNPAHQKPYYNYILNLKPTRIIFNPGTENDEFISLAEKNGIKTIEACTLVMLGTGQY